MSIEISENMSEKKVGRYARKNVYMSEKDVRRYVKGNINRNVRKYPAASPALERKQCGYVGREQERNGWRSNLVFVSLSHSHLLGNIISARPWSRGRSSSSIQKLQRRTQPGYRSTLPSGTWIKSAGSSTAKLILHWNMNAAGGPALSKQVELAQTVWALKNTKKQS